MCLVALQDPGLTVFPTHRLRRRARRRRTQEALADTLREHFDIEPIDADRAARRRTATARSQLGYLDAHFKQPFRLTLKDQAIADAALAGFPEPYRHLDTAVLEALLLKGPLGLTDDDISHLHGLGYSRTDEEALRARRRPASRPRVLPAPDARSSRSATIAAAGVNMPPKSTFFFPKVPTGLLFNPLDRELLEYA